MVQRKAATPVILVLAALVASLFSSSAWAATHAVSMIDNSFVPATITIAAGDTIVWTNNGNEVHTATAVNGSFSSPELDRGETYSRTFSTPGTIPYYCTLHAGEMEGTIVVQGTAPTTTSTTQAPTTTTSTTQAPTTTTSTTQAPTTTTSTTQAPTTTTSTTQAPTTTTSTTQAPTTTSTTQAPTTTTSTTQAPTTTTSTTVAPTTTTSTSQAPTTTSTTTTSTTQAPTTTTSTTQAPTTTSTTQAPTTTTSTTQAPTTTTTTGLPPPGGPLQFDDVAKSNASMVRLTGSISCDEGHRFRLRVLVSQGETEGAGVTTGTCTGAPQRFRVIVRTVSGPGFDDGAAEVDATVDIGDPATRAIVDTFSTSDDVEIDIPGGMTAALLDAIEAMEKRQR